MGHPVNEFNSLCWLRYESMIIPFFGCKELINGIKTSPATCQINRRKSDCNSQTYSWRLISVAQSIDRKLKHGFPTKWCKIIGSRFLVPLSRNEWITCFAYSI